MRGYPHEEKNSTQNTPPKCANVRSGYSKKSAHSALPTGLPSRRLRPSGCRHYASGTASIRTHKTPLATVAQQEQNARIKALERENYELKRSNEILRQAYVVLTAS